MPTYCYEDKRGNVYEHDFSMGKAPRSIQVEGVVCSRSLSAEFMPSVQPCSGYPFTCHASGVNADQSGELRSYLSKKGVPTEVTSDGDPVYRSPKHRKQALKARGMHDRAAYN